MRISASSVKTYRACPRKYKIQYVDGYESLEQGPPLILGSAVHAGLEKIWEGSTVSAAQMASKPFMRDLSETDGIKVNAMIAAYHDKYAENIKENWEVIALERRFETHVAAKVRGVFDGLVRNKKTKELFILEHKTAARIDKVYWQKLNFDPQLTIYQLAAEELYHEPVSVLYDVIQKPSVRKDSSLEEITDTMIRRNGYFFQQRVVRFNRNKFEGNVQELISTIHTISRDSVFPRNNQSCGFCPFVAVCSGEETLDNTALYKLRRKK